MAKEKAKTKRGKRGRTQKLDNKVKRWWKFYSINGTCQHHLELTEVGAHTFAREKGYVGRYEKATAPKAAKKRKKAAAKKT